MKEEPLRVQGRITRKLPKGSFEVTLVKNDHKVIAVPSGKMRQFKLKICAGDWVDVELTPYDLTKGRIVWRYTQKPEEERG